MIKQDLNRRRVYECRCDERLKSTQIFVVYFYSIKRKLNRRLICDFRCDERLKAKVEGSTRLAYTGWTFVYYESIKRELKTKVIHDVGSSLFSVE